MGLVQFIRCRIFGYLRAALFDGRLDRLENFLEFTEFVGAGLVPARSDKCR